MKSVNSGKSAGQSATPVARRELRTRLQVAPYGALFERPFRSHCHSNRKWLECHFLILSSIRIQGGIENDSVRTSRFTSLCQARGAS